MLVKKYRGGRQEDYVKTGFALSWDLPFLLFYLIFKVFFFMSYFGNIYLFFSFEKNTFISNICFMLCLSYQNLLVIFNIVRMYC